MSTIAVLQMTSGVDPAGNADTLIAGMAQAREGGADMLFAPEMALLLDRDRKHAGETMAADGYPALVDRLRNAAREHSIWATFGLPVRLEGGMLANRSLLIAPTGEIAGRYDKLHMFDVDLDSGESWRESNAYQPGEALSVTGDTPAGRLGLTICYDIRFPALFDALGRAGCDMIAIPAAFTVPTGSAHWHTLVRAPSWSPRRRSANMPTGAGRMATAWWSTRGARCCSIWAARKRVWALPRSTRIG